MSNSNNTAPSIDTSEQRERDITTGLFGLSNEIIRIIFYTTVDIRYRFFPIKSAFRRFFLHRQRILAAFHEVSDTSISKKNAKTFKMLFE
jgi:hypothetical protein